MKGNSNILSLLINTQRKELRTQSRYLIATSCMPAFCKWTRCDGPSLVEGVLPSDEKGFMFPELNYEFHKYCVKFFYYLLTYSMEQSPS